MSLDAAVSGLSAAVAVLPATLHIEVSTGLAVLGLAALLIWRGRS